jgi:regulator of protease activity HflC (stomatin/prohibitin superfamily)
MVMWKVSAVAIPIAVAALVVTGEWWAGLLTGAILVAFILAAKAAIVIVPERKAAVIRNRLKFYAGLRGPGLGFILPLWEHVATYLDLGPKLAEFVVSDIHTLDRVPIAIALSFFYRLDPWKMQPELRSQLVDNLEYSAPAILQRQTLHLLHQLVGQQEIAALLQPEMRQYLEDRLAKQLSHQVQRLGVEILDEVMLASIALPEAVQAEINSAQRARIHAQARADVLDTLREALGAQPDGAWEKVIEVEAVDAMARSGMPLFIPYSKGWIVDVPSSQAVGKSQNGKDV